MPFTQTAQKFKIPGKGCPIEGDRENQGGETNSAEQEWAEQLLWAIPWPGGQTHSSLSHSLMGVGQDKPFYLRQQPKGPSVTAHLRQLHPF